MEMIENDVVHNDDLSIDLDVNSVRVLLTRLHKKIMDTLISRIYVVEFESAGEVQSIESHRLAIITIVPRDVHALYPQISIGSGEDQGQAKQSDLFSMTSMTKRRNRIRTA